MSCEINSIASLTFCWACAVWSLILVARSLPVNAVNAAATTIRATTIPIINSTSVKPRSVAPYRFNGCRSCKAHPSFGRDDCDQGHIPTEYKSTSRRVGVPVHLDGHLALIQRGWPKRTLNGDPTLNARQICRI